MWDRLWTAVSSIYMTSQCLTIWTPVGLAGLLGFPPRPFLLPLIHVLYPVISPQVNHAPRYFGHGMLFVVNDPGPDVFVLYLLRGPLLRLLTVVALFTHPP